MGIVPFFGMIAALSALCAMPHWASLNLEANTLIVLGIETSCDETGIAIYDSERGLLGDALFSQVDIHAEYGG